MFKKKEILIISILAVLVTVFMGYFFDFPFRPFEPSICILVVGAHCPPRIVWPNALLDFLFWLLVLLGGWWVFKKLKLRN